MCVLRHEYDCAAAVVAAGVRAQRLGVDDQRGRQLRRAGAHLRNAQSRHHQGTNTAFNAHTCTCVNLVGTCYLENNILRLYLVVVVVIFYGTDRWACSL